MSPAGCLMDEAVPRIRGVDFVRLVPQVVNRDIWRPSRPVDVLSNQRAIARLAGVGPAN